MSRSMRQHLLNRRWVPAWWTGPNRGRVLWSIGTMLDAAVSWAESGMRERFPLWCSEEALHWHGRDKGILRGAAESSESYRQRLTRWRQLRARAGSAWGILEAVQSYFLPNVPRVRLVSSSLTAAQWWTLDSDGSATFHRQSPTNWDWDSLEPGQTPIDNHRRFWILVYEGIGDVGPHLFPFQGLSAAPNAEITRGTKGLKAAADDLLLLANAFKQAGTWCAGVIMVGDNTLFNPLGIGAGYPDGRWYRYSDPTTYQPIRPTGARYFHDRRRPSLAG